MIQFHGRAGVRTGVFWRFSGGGKSPKNGDDGDSRRHPSREDVEHVAQEEDPWTPQDDQDEQQAPPPRPPRADRQRVAAARPVAGGRARPGDDGERQDRYSAAPRDAAADRGEGE